LSGEIRQGALEGIMVEAVARAATVPASEVRRALMVAGDLGVLAAASVAAAPVPGATEAPARFRLTIWQPIQPMLAQTAPDLTDALARIHPAVVEWKLDGARLQGHRVGGEVRGVTRDLADITDRVPEVVEAVREVAAVGVVAC